MSSSSDQTKRIKTAENWYPTHEDGTVKVGIGPLSPKGWRVSVWGEDDFGMERDFLHVERQEAKALYAKLVDGVTKKQMKEVHGMWNA